MLIFLCDCKCLTALCVTLLQCLALCRVSCAKVLDVCDGGVYHPATLPAGPWHWWQKASHGWAAPGGPCACSAQHKSTDVKKCSQCWLNCCSQTSNRGSVNCYIQTCISDMLNGCLMHQICGQRSTEMHKTITTTHQILFSASQWVKHRKCTWKSHVNCRKRIQQCFGCLIALSAVKCKTVRSCDKPQSAWRALRNLDFSLKKVFRFMASDVTLWKFLVTP